MSWSHDPTQLAALAVNGYELIPLNAVEARDARGRKIGKAPMGSKWRLLPALSIDEAKEHMVTGHNVGVRLRPEDLVLDADPRNYDEGDDPLVRLAADLGIDLDAYPKVVTGSGGFHIYMKKSADALLRDTLEAYPGLEFKAHGRQVVAPGSVHPGDDKTGLPPGGMYGWDNDPLAVGLAEAAQAPAALIDLARRPGRGATVHAGSRSPEELERMLDGLDPTQFREHAAWFEIMCACHHATAGEGREEFIAWSTGDPEFSGDGSVIGRRWDTLHADQDERKITEKTLFKALVDHNRADLLPRDRAADDFAGVDEDRLDGPTIPPKLAEVNARHFTVLTAGKYLVGRESACPYFGNVDVEWFPDIAVKKHLDARTVTLEDGTRRPLGSWWITHSGRRQYDGVVFDPTPGAKHPGLYNLWRGWSVEPVKGDWSLMQGLLRDVLCGGDQASFEYVLKWAAHMVQHPNVPAEVALVFKGGKGVGKGTFLRALKNLAGQHGRQVAQAEHFTGKFNEHLMDTILLFVDEGLWAGDRKLEGALKNLITEPVLTFEGKHKPVVSGPNRLHVVIASNEDWVVPASDDERRFAVFEADTEARRRLPAHFFDDLRRQMDGGGLAAMLFDLHNMSLEGWHPRSDIPSTRALTEQKVQSFRGDPLAFWWYRALEDGQLPISGDWNDGLYIDSAGKGDLVAAVEHQASIMRKRAEFTKNQLARFLGKVGVDVYARDRKGGRAWWVPALRDARAAFEGWVGGSIDWDEENERT